MPWYAQPRLTLMPSAAILPRPVKSAAVAAHRHADPHRLSQLVRGDLDWIVMKCLEKDRTRRYETATGVAADAWTRIMAASLKMAGIAVKQALPRADDQIPALPLGGRVKLNAWDDHVELIKTAPVAITSARDKMPFEVTPFFPRLTRYGSVANPGSTSAQ